MTATRAPVAVLGAGSWGTALALVLARHGHPVRLWGHDPATVAALAGDRANERYLPGVSFPDGLVPTAGLAEALQGASFVLIAVPSRAFRATLEAVSAHLPEGRPVVWATKGLDPSGGLLHETATRCLPGHPLAVLSGPSFAREVAAGLPTAVSVAATDTAFARQLAGAFHGDAFRVYTSGDLVGVELGGAVKNVLAIATGIGDGLGLGANARAGLITRGLAEIRRLGRALGADDTTFTGLSGAGDLILTCTDDQSRNRRFGMALGRGEPPDAAEAAIGQTVEGRHTAEDVRRLAARHGVDMPICESVYRIVVHGDDPERTAHDLMLRAPKAEFE